MHDLTRPNRRFLAALLALLLLAAACGGRDDDGGDEVGAGDDESSETTEAEKKELVAVPGFDLTTIKVGALTPLTGFTSGSFDFNPGSAVNVATNTIELPSGHKMLTGQAVTYARSGGAALTISATGTDYSHAVSESGTAAMALRK